METRFGSSTFPRPPNTIWPPHRSERSLLDSGCLRHETLASEGGCHPPCLPRPELPEPVTYFAFQNTNSVNYPEQHSSDVSARSRIPRAASSLTKSHWLVTLMPIHPGTQLH